MAINTKRRNWLVGKLLLLTLAAPGQAWSSTLQNNSDSQSTKSCVVIDNDFDIDDMMAIPPVLGAKHVAAIIQSEGYTLPEQAAPAVDALVNQIPDQPNNRKIPIIVGAKQEAGPNLERWPWLPFFRAMMNRSNGLLATKPSPWPKNDRYTEQLKEAVAHCDNISVLIIGTYTSFINYLPAIREKVDRVVIMGQRIGDESRTEGRESFNCNYDIEACRKAMPMLDGLKAYFVDIPRFPDCHDTINLPSHCYSPSLSMVTGSNIGRGRTQGGLLESGLPGRTRQALINSIQCKSFYTTPKTQGRPCSSKSTWEPGSVAEGPGGEMLLWDQSAAHFLIRPEDFALYYPPNNPSIGGQHYEPVLIDGSHEKTVKMLRAAWTEFTNESNHIK